MLRKTKTANVVAAISIIVILISSSISTIPVFARENKQEEQQQPGGAGSPQGNQTTTAVIWIVNGAGTNTSSLGYSPANATVIMGVNNTVTWVNNDTNPHTVTSRTVPAGAQMFDSGIFAPNENYTYTFNTTGTYNYFCSLHPWMMGNITVMGGNQTIPGGNQTVPGGNQTIPGGNQTVPGGNQTVPGGNQTQMAIIWILSGAGTNTSSLGYSPANATVMIGTNNTVTWINNDTNPHTVTSTLIPAGVAAFDSGIIQPNQNFTYTFTVAGDYHYYCTLHPWMMGNVTVLGGNQSIPGGNQTLPGGNQTVPGGNQTVPGGNQSIPGGNYTASRLTFQGIIIGNLKVAGTISNSIITMFPSRFTQIGTVSRP